MISGQESVKSEYARLAKQYDKRWDKYVSKTTEETLKFLDLSEANSLLDIGCGTGRLLELIQDKSPQVSLHGIDLSPEMIGIAQSKIPKANLKVGDASDLPYPANSMDVVTSVSSFHYWRNPLDCLAEVRRVLKPHGQFVLTDWCDDYLTCQICNFLLNIFNSAHLKTYKLEECEKILKDSGFIGIRSRKYKIDFLWGMMTLAMSKME